MHSLHRIFIHHILINKDIIKTYLKCHKNELRPKFSISLMLKFFLLKKCSTFHIMMKYETKTKAMKSGPFF
jgi:hypothetical protein